MNAAILAAHAPGISAEDRTLVYSADLQTSAPIHAVTNQAISLSWQNVPLRQALQRLAVASNSFIHLDRRIDPGTRVNLTARNAGAREVLAELASDHQWAVSSLDDLFYLGPISAVGELQTLVVLRNDELADLPAIARNRFRQVAGSAWPHLTSARNFIDRTARQAGLPVVNADRIPFDIWAAGQLPPLPLTERLTVLLSGFDLTFRAVNEGNALELITIRRPVVCRRRYQLPRPDRINLAILRQQLPNASLNTVGQTIEIQGRWEDHEQLMALLSVSSSSRRPRQRRLPAMHVYTLHVREQTLASVIEQLATRLDLEVEFDRSAIQAAGISMEQRITFSVDDVDLDGLLRAALLPAGLDFELDRQQWRIFPPTKPK